jgi:predicted enzyme related to lactoylglutathione lyase
MNAIGWVEVPVSDMGRAIKFYNAVLEWELKEVKLGELIMAWFPWDHSAPGAAGSLVRNPNYTPSALGSLVYFSCADVATQIGRVEAAGGEVLCEKTQISPEHGYMGLAMDSEGNRIAFHSEK